jgi:hypothetical protein
MYVLNFHLTIEIHNTSTYYLYISHEKLEKPCSSTCQMPETRTWWFRGKLRKMEFRRHPQRFKHECTRKRRTELPSYRWRWKSKTEHQAKRNTNGRISHGSIIAANFNCANLEVRNGCTNSTTIPRKRREYAQSTRSTLFMHQLERRFGIHRGYLALPRGLRV